MLQKIFSRLAKAELNNSQIAVFMKDRRLKLSYDGKVLTTDICIHSSIMINGSWFSSAQGVCSCNRQNDDLSITVDWKEIPVRHIWQVKKIKYGFNFTVYMDIKSPVKIEKMLCGIMLDQEYEKWFANIEEGIFPEFNTGWENVFLQDAQSRLLGVNNTANLPAVIIENLQHGYLILQNSPLGYQSRALRIEMDKYDESFTPNRYKPFNFNLYVIGGEERTADFLIKKRNQLLKLKQLSEGDLKIVFDKTSAAVCWGQRRLTVNQGLHAALLVDNEWFDSSKAQWKIERINDQCIYIDIDWRPLPIRQSWQITLKNSYSFIWKVRTSLKEDRKNLIKMQSLGLVLSPEYRQWFSGYESGCFPERFSSWQEISQDTRQGTIGLKNHEPMPGVLLKNVNGSNAKLLVQNGDMNAGARFLQAISIFDENNNPLSDQECTLQISFAVDGREIDDLLKNKIETEIMRCGLKNGYLKLIAGKGKVRLFAQSKEVTKDIGLHSAICSGGHWYDSGKMKWKIDKVNDEYLKLKVDFSPFPAVQTWHLKLTGEDTISWDIDMQLIKEVEIEEYKAGMIIDGAYQEWFNSFEQGRFPDKFSFWHDIIRNRDRETFGTYPVDGLPGVMFSIDDKHTSLIQNTDENIKGRVLQGQLVETEETKKYPAKTFECFKGKIRLVKSRAKIEEHREKVQPLLAKTEAIYLYADEEFLHNRISGVNEFKDKIKKIDELKNKNQEFKLAIGVSRYNFFKLHEILKFAAGKLGKNLDVRIFKLTIFPLKRLRRNFIEYLEELKKIAGQIGNIEFVLADKELFKLITSICAQADSGNERQLVRLLGVVCEHAFIGPQIVVIDPYHRCNANCIHCWVHTPKVYHPKEYYQMQLDMDKFKTIADDLADLMVDLIIFQGDGEPLLHKDFFDMVSYARNKGINVSFFTNGILLDKSTAQKALENEISEIFCSLPAGTAKTFSEINTKQKEKVFHQILDNLRILCQLKKSKAKNNPRLIMTHVIHNLNAHELVEMAKNDIEIGADVMRFYLIRLDENIEFLKLNENDLIKIRKSMDEVKKLAEGKDIQLLDTTDFQLDNFEMRTGSWSKNVFLEKGCTLGWNFCLIPASGEVSFCCHLRTVGYLNKNNFKEIWNSKEYGRFRYQAKFLSENSKEKFLNGTPLFDDYCQHCDTHQVIRDVWDQFKLYNLEQFC